MGLPDTSQRPRRTRWDGYIPVYEGEQDDDSSVKVSGRQAAKAGVQTEVAVRRT